MNEVRLDLNKVRNLEDMLQGNINRMCLTHDMKELNDMRTWASNYITKIFEMNCYRINEERINEEIEKNVEEDGEEEGEEW